MERRTILALILIMVVAIVPTILFPPKPPVTRPAAGVSPDTSAPTGRAADSAPTVPALRGQSQPPPAPPAVDASDRIVTVESALYQYRFSTRGARLISATLKPYRSFGLHDSVSAFAQILPDSSRFLALSVVVGADTVDLSDWTFAPSADQVDVAGGANELAWTGRRGDATVLLRYRFHDDNYLFDINGDLRGMGVRSGLVLVGLGPRLRMIERDSVGDIGQYSVVTKARSTEKITFGSLDPGERRNADGPFDWVALKSKYFLAAVLTVEPGAPQLGGVALEGAPRTGRMATAIRATATLPVPAGTFTASIYAGPQQYDRLTAVGHDFNDVNPYGWSVFRVIIQPASVAVMRMLLWMHDHLHLAYGWVILVFGVAVRLALWPLNQKAMRSGMAMQAIQPQMKALQEKYKKDPQKLQTEMMTLYREHGVNPLGGCLPMLIPMPVLFAVWFVLSNTIEFRGVPFLWLPDLALADPLYIVPIVSGILMFLVTKIGQMGMPPNPQATMMMYTMPIMFTVLFLNLASGVSLYYGVQNLASLPQQWLIAQERRRRAAKAGGG